MNCQNLIRLAYKLAADESTDRSTHVGALLVTPAGDIKVYGINSFTDNKQALDPRNHERPRKYKVIEHAERAAIFKAACLGIRTKGLIMIAPWASCPDCARAIVLAGILMVIGHKQAFEKTPLRWKEEVAFGIEIMQGGGVEYILYDGLIGGVENLFNGEIWLP